MKSVSVKEASPHKVEHRKEQSVHQESKAQDNSAEGILLAAARAAARCLHIDVTETKTDVRIRIGGRLRKMTSLSHDAGYALADLLEDSVRGEEGLIELQGGAVMLRYRLTVCTAAHGQRLVVTLLPPKEEDEAGNLSMLGAPAEVESFLSKQLGRSRGIVLVAGLQGSRRSRTILAMGGELHENSASVVKLADSGSNGEATSAFPVLTLDHQLELWRVLDQIDGMDADCVLLPEIKTGFHVNLALALTGAGRLGIAPVRAQDVAGAMVMLMDLGASRYRAARDISGIVAQHRLPKPCPFCANLHRLSREEVPSEGWDPDSRRELLNRGPLVRSRGTGCNKCHGSGYAGWNTIYECLEIEGRIAERIREVNDPGELREELKQLTVTGGLLESAWREVLRGNIDPASTGAIPGPDVVPFRLSPESLSERPVVPGGEGFGNDDVADNFNHEDLPSIFLKATEASHRELRARAGAAIRGALEILDRGESLNPDPLAESASEIVSAVNSSPGLLVEALQGGDGSDLVTRQLNVAILTTKIGAGLGWDVTRLEQGAFAAMIHDAGLLKVPDEIRFGEDRSPEETKIWRRHAIWGEEMLRASIPGYGWMASVVRQVHERESGAGFPDGLKSEEIDPMAKVIGLADELESLTSGTSSTSAMTTFDAIQILSRDRSKEFNNKIIRSMARSISLFPVGTLVRLNNSSIARVTSVNEENFHRPSVEILSDASGKELARSNEVDLSDSPFLYITGPVSERDSRDREE
jgi:HD-GYP domain-containing protein (c-di-GMP phosphodiesterase class II)/type II secretory ATPase GspE/PulE/Tfp pilus assembly ATPase PilB-like protein